MKRVLTLMLMSIALISFIIGCGENSADSGDDLEQLAADFGGFMPSDEAPAFGDPDLLAMVDDDVEFDDQILATPSVDSIIDDAAEAGSYALRIIWGSLEFDSTVTEVTDWTGSLTITRGAEIIRRVIAFEDGQDYIVPRTDRKLIEWVSKTTVHHDGIFVNLYIPAIDTTDTLATDEPVTVNFTTGPFSKTFTLDEIAAIDTVYYLDDDVNAVSVRGFKIYPRECPKGFLEGYWGKDSTGMGVFKGRWISQHGVLAGYLFGHYGIDPDDPDSATANMFFGKYIDVNGQFEGLLKGEYKGWNINFSGNGNNYFWRHFGGGWFRGQFYDANGNPMGVLRGSYHRPRCDCEDGRGFFKGRWKTYCPEMTANSLDDGMNF